MRGQESSSEGEAFGTTPTVAYRHGSPERRRDLVFAIRVRSYRPGPESRAGRARAWRTRSGSRWSAPPGAWAGCWSRRSARRPAPRLSGATERPGHEWIGRDVGEAMGGEAIGVIVEDDPLEVFARSQAVLDFTVPEATLAHAELAAQARLVHVVGTTGLERPHLEKLAAAARHAVIVRSGNMSVGVNLLAVLARKVAAVLGHRLRHRDRRDAPPRQGRRALRHRADVRRGGGRRPRRQPRRRRRARPRRRRPAPARSARSASPACAAATSSASTR